ncbi:MAG: hypothetical protein AAF799_46885 [Myxococcota bacterium]
MSNESQQTTFKDPPHLFVRLKGGKGEWFFRDAGGGSVHLQSHDLTIEHGKVEKDIQDFSLTILNELHETITLEVKGEGPATVVAPEKKDVPAGTRVTWECKTGGGEPHGEQQRATWTILPPNVGVKVEDPTFRVRWQAGVGPDL